MKQEYIDNNATYYLYHSNKWNALIHIACEPLFLACLVVLLNLIYFPGPLSLGAIFFVGLVAFSMTIEFVSAVIGGFLVWLLTIPLQSLVSIEHGILYFLAILFSVAFLQQYIGHFIIQKNKPKYAYGGIKGFVIALTDSLYIWPLFGLLKLGYRVDLRKQINQAIHDKKISVIDSHIIDNTLSN